MECEAMGSVGALRKVKKTAERLALLKWKTGVKEWKNT